jgi:hypothetical protein
MRRRPVNIPVAESGVGARISISARAVIGSSRWPIGTAEVGTRGNWDRMEGCCTVAEAINAGVIGV